MADVKKINSSLPTKKTGGVYQTGKSVPPGTSNTVNTEELILEAGAQNAGDNVANTYPGATCIKTSDGVALSMDSGGCFVLPVDSSGAATDLSVTAPLTGEGTALSPLQIVLSSSGGLRTVNDELEVNFDYTGRGLQWYTSVSGTQTIDWSTPPFNKAIRLISDVTLSFTAPVEEGDLRLVVDQGPAGGHTVTFPTLSGSTPVVASTANARTVINLFWDGDYYHV